MAERVARQHERQDAGSACMGGHLFVAYEQYTQQSPAFGRKTALQLSHS
jgi:dTDP-4-dehydrorhamnose 3,5-epimerase-like enzyme